MRLKRLATLEKKYQQFSSAVYVWESRHPDQPLPPLPFFPKLPDNIWMPKQWGKHSSHGTMKMRLSNDILADPVSRRQLSFFSSATNPIQSIYPVKTMKAPKAHRLNEMGNHIVKTSDSVQTLCCGCCQYDHIEYMEMDHLQAASDILSRQKTLIRAMQSDPLFSEEILNIEGMSEYFKYQSDAPILGTKLFYLSYYNDISNIWLLSRRLNRDKGNKQSIKWLNFQRAQYYGAKFVDYISPLNTSGIMIKTYHGQGLADAAQQWLVTHHAIAVSLAKPILSIEQNAYEKSRNITHAMEENGSTEGVKKGMGLARTCWLLEAILEEEDLMLSQSESALSDMILDDKENEDEQVAIQAFISAGIKAYQDQKKRSRGNSIDESFKQSEAPDAS